MPEKKSTQRYDNLLFLAIGFVSMGLTNLPSAWNRSYRQCPTSPLLIKCALSIMVVGLSSMDIKHRYSLNLYVISIMFFEGLPESQKSNLIIMSLFFVNSRRKIFIRQHNIIDIIHDSLYVWLYECNL